MASNNGTAEQLMQALASGRGNNYGYKMSQRPAAGTIRGISNAPPITSDRFGGAPIPGNMMPDYAGRTATGFGGLSAEDEMLLQKQGYVDSGDIRYVLDRETGQVARSPTPWSRYSTSAMGYPNQRTPTTLEQAVGGPGAMKPSYPGMLPALEKQMMEEKYRRRGR